MRYMDIFYNPQSGLSRVRCMCMYISKHKYMDISTQYIKSMLLYSCLLSIQETWGRVKEDGNERNKQLSSDGLKE